MKKIIGEVIQDTDQMLKICGRISARSHSNDAIGWETIHRREDYYYLETTGGSDLFAPADDLEVIAEGARGLLAWAEGTPWAVDAKLIEHLESLL